MTELRWEVVEVISGDIEAELLRGLLEAQEIPVMLSKEGAGHALGLQIGPLSEIQILVPSTRREEARQILAVYYAGGYASGEGSTQDQDASEDPFSKDEPD
jgi:hypothetical protein